jgi:hypothetical protein
LRRVAEAHAGNIHVGPNRAEGSPSIERRIVHWLDDDITVEFNVPEVIGPQLEPRLQRRRDVEWLGIIRCSEGHCVALGRLRATGKLVEVVGGSISMLRPHIAAVVSAALDAEIGAIMRDLPRCTATNSGHQ